MLSDLGILLGNWTRPVGLEALINTGHLRNVAPCSTHRGLANIRTVGEVG